MKKFYFNVQSKGGSGKSMLTYLQGLKHEHNKSVAFVDLDHAVKTSSAQLQFLARQERLFVMDIYNKQKKVDREKLFKVLEVLNKQDFSETIIDFGATESEQLLRFLEYDFTVDEFKAFEQELGASFVFNVVVAGGTGYLACSQYLMKLAEILEGNFEIRAYANEFFFHEENRSLINELSEFIERSGGRISSLRVFGKISPDTESGKTIIEHIKAGNGFDSYIGYAAKMIIQREMKRV
jgi:hypothetical protein